MRMYRDYGLIHEIAEEFSIKKGQSEREAAWGARVIYSLMGQMALASLFDVPEDGSTSIVHMKSRIRMLADTYKKIYPDVADELPADSSELADEIYDIYLNTGGIYHKQKRVVMAAPSEGSSSGVLFTRGHSIEEHQKICGLGTFQLTAHSNESLGEMFMLGDSSLEEQWEQYVHNVRWLSFNYEASIEYLRMSGPFKRGYWLNQPDTKNVVSILRVGAPGSRLYYLYRVRDRELQVSPLPSWCSDNAGYLALANACLYYNRTLPPTRYHIDEDVVDIHFGYLMPSPERYLWKLYSWPRKCCTLKDDFNRICDKNVFEAIRNVIVQQGYQFVEV